MTAFAREMRGAPGPSSPRTAGGERTPGRDLEKASTSSRTKCDKTVPADTHGLGMMDHGGKKNNLFFFFFFLLSLKTYIHFLKSGILDIVIGLILVHTSDPNYRYTTHTLSYTTHTHTEFAQGYAKFHLHPDSRT